MNESKIKSLSLEKAASLVNDGKIIAVETETVFGLCCSFDNKNAIQKLYEIKNRDFSKPFTVGIIDLETIDSYNPVFYNHDHRQRSYELIIKGVTVILKVEQDSYFGPHVSPTNTLAFRMPSADAYELLDELYDPIALTSCNISGQKLLINIDEINSIFDDKIEGILYTNQTIDNKPSTIIDATDVNFKLLRQGIHSIEVNS